MDHATAFAAVPETVREFGFFIDGTWRDTAGRDTLLRSSPGYGRDVSRVTLCTRADLDEAVAAARAAFKRRVWSGIGGAERAAVLLRVARAIRARVEELAFWETLETGKPISQSRAEINDAAGHFEYCAGQAQSLSGETFNNHGDDMFGVVTREPVGVVGLINPWNFPFIVLAERLPYILASGNSVVVKPSEMTSATTLMCADILKESGLPDGVYNVVTGTGPEVGQAIAEHRDIDMVSFTGSTRTGEAVLKASAANFKKASLELGGKNPQIVFADADLEDAADGVAFGLCFNAGQCCVSGSRLVVEESVAERFKALVVEKLSKVKLGDCLDPETQLGAIVSEQHCDKILGYVDLGRQEGADVVCGGERVSVSGGRFVAPTLLAGVRNDMRVAREEIFGPVLCLMTFRTVEEALEIANDSPYGLAASIWTKDIDKALRVMRGVQAGRTWVNTTIAGGPGQPLGGFKQSGIGREGGRMGVEEYTEVKSVHIAIGKRTPWVK
ncbi:aldehyde dehydrogenase family protein [Shinella pollutisoli]|uniref:Aldehyde dehydrogenase family protein n=1 Tax=Shinella pollutisoli TaxID=2250594 RepID=A0ABV7DDU5_9HYPH|nr:aldehyde dehydrogenase family protein [Shinella pollutisoli]